MNIAALSVKEISRHKNLPNDTFRNREGKYFVRLLRSEVHQIRTKASMTKQMWPPAELSIIKQENIVEQCNRPGCSVFAAAMRLKTANSFDKPSRLYILLILISSKLMSVEA